MATAFLFFAIAIFLFPTLESHYATSATTTSDQGVEVSYGSVIKLMHEKTKFRLHSHSVPYGSGSGQQSVTCFPRVDDSNSYWIVRPVPETSARQGDSIETGTVIRLQHMRTRKWLHSHLHASPISGNLESSLICPSGKGVGVIHMCEVPGSNHGHHTSANGMHAMIYLPHDNRGTGAVGAHGVSCFGNDGSSDAGDHWRLEIEGSGKTWKQDQKIRLHHVETGGYLHSHDKKYNGVAGGQQEVCGVKEKRGTNIWLAAEGIFFRTTEKK
ncbi:hypothetical protein OSB04_021622 [Centaurea solstitialis]|uniref:MIR domain-containing protein n=1 Tax=Centaurea solstitialis TaxID=347529 RepID=A0AA38WGF1_9ASTR|nr:hypothetical protein OSB04_021622 [Centaurea solstitialis]